MIISDGTDVKVGDKVVSPFGHELTVVRFTAKRVVTRKSRTSPDNHWVPRMLTSVKEA